MLEIEPYEAQLHHWPTDGRGILANYDDETIVVYQAYRPEIGHFAAKHGYFGGEFKLSRMSWIKPNFLWMMYRCGWGTKTGQEVVLAIRLLRSAFDEILAGAVHSSFKSKLHGDRETWKRMVDSSDVRLQWDPDHEPNGLKCDRRAIQLGLRGEVLEKYSREWITEIEDISDFVSRQRVNASTARYSDLEMPRERIYPVSESAIIEKLQLDHV